MTYKEANIVRIEHVVDEIVNRIILQTEDDGQQMELEVEEKWLQQMGLNEGMPVKLLIHTDGTAIIQK